MKARFVAREPGSSGRAGDVQVTDILELELPEDPAARVAVVVRGFTELAERLYYEPGADIRLELE